MSRITCIAWLAVASSAFAEDAKVTVISERDAEPPKEVRLETSIGQETHYRMGRLLFQMSDVERKVFSPMASLWAAYSITYDVPWNAKTNPWKAGDRDYYTQIMFEEGHVFPLSSAVYRVEKLAKTLAEDHLEGFAVLKRIDDEWARTVVPQGDSLVIVLNRGSAMVHNVGIDVTAITANASDPQKPSIATVVFAIGKPPQLAPTARVSDADTLVFPTWKGQPKVYKHKVRRVVPPDKAKGVIGWIELDPEPIVEDPKP